ncbi:hypothetical protein GQR58_015152 [Nymphon striatum]|nr:hypothetical protein GQR58_015152 [Nymphon striatum]
MTGFTDKESTVLECQKKEGIDGRRSCGDGVGGGFRHRPSKQGGKETLLDDGYILETHPPIQKVMTSNGGFREVIIHACYAIQYIHCRAALAFASVCLLEILPHSNGPMKSQNEDQVDNTVI